MLNKNPKIYIQIDKDSLLLSKLEKQRNKFILTDNETFKLENSEIQEGIICNTSGLFEKIFNFLKRNKLHGSYAVVYNPSLQDSSNKDLIAFQTSLAISKTGLKIYKLIESNILKESKKCQIYSFIKKIWKRN